MFPAIFSLKSLNGTNGFTITGLAANDDTGTIVKNAGDINGDGKADIVIGTYSTKVGNLKDAGQVSAIFGNSTPFASIIDISSLNGSNGFIITGLTQKAYLGYSVSSADINEDGRSDLIIGAYGADVGSMQEAGQVYVVFGRSSGFPASFSLATLNGTNGFVINGLSKQGNLGWAVAGLGDISGDGIADFAISAPNTSPSGRKNAGQVYVIFGKTGIFVPSFNLGSLNGTNGFVVSGIATDDRLADAIAGLDDVTGDGKADIVIGAAKALNNFGQVYTIFGRAEPFQHPFNLLTLNGTNGFAVNGISENANFGLSVDIARDISGDKKAEILIGASLATPSGINNGGQTYIIFGRASFVSTFSLPSINGANGFSVSGLSDGAKLGVSISGIGDVNADGRSDLIIGAYGTDLGSLNNAGQVFIIYGKSSGFLPTLSLATLNGTNGFIINGTVKSNYLGQSVSRAGDVNGDGAEDFLVASSISNGGVYVVFGIKSILTTSKSITGTKSGTLPSSYSKTLSKTLSKTDTITASYDTHSLSGASSHTSTKSDTVSQTKRSSNSHTATITHSRTFSKTDTITPSYHTQTLSNTGSQIETKSHDSSQTKSLSWTITPTKRSSETSTNTKRSLTPSSNTHTLSSSDSHTLINTHTPTLTPSFTLGETDTAAPSQSIPLTPTATITSSPSTHSYANIHSATSTKSSSVDLTASLTDIHTRTPTTPRSATKTAATELSSTHTVSRTDLHTVTQSHTTARTNSISATDVRTSTLASALSFTPSLTQDATASSTNVFTDTSTNTRTSSIALKTPSISVEFESRTLTDSSTHNDSVDLYTTSPFTQAATRTGTYGYHNVSLDLNTTIDQKGSVLVKATLSNSGYSSAFILNDNFLLGGTACTSDIKVIAGRAEIYCHIPCSGNGDISKDFSELAPDAEIKKEFYFPFICDLADISVGQYTARFSTTMLICPKGAYHNFCAPQVLQDHLYFEHTLSDRVEYFTETPTGEFTVTSTKSVTKTHAVSAQEVIASPTRTSTKTQGFSATKSVTATGSGTGSHTDSESVALTATVSRTAYSDTQSVIRTQFQTGSLTAQDAPFSSSMLCPQASASILKLADLNITAANSFVYDVKSGDINNDGYSDLIISSPYIKGDGHSITGVVHILLNVSAAMSAGSIDLSALSNTNSKSPQYGITIVGAFNSKLGYGGTTIADLDRNGKLDLIISAGLSNDGAGAIYALLNVPAIIASNGLNLNNPLVNSPASTLYGFSIIGPLNGNLGLGGSVVTDINFNGRPDLMFAAPTYSGGVIFGLLNIPAAIVSGSFNLQTSTLSNDALSPRYGFNITHTTTNAMLGSSGLNTTDIDSNGRIDLITSAPGVNRMYFLLNMAEVIAVSTVDVSASPTNTNSSASTYGASILGPNTNCSLTGCRFGSALPIVRDLNRDGSADVIAFAPGAASGAGIIYGLFNIKQIIANNGLNLNSVNTSTDSLSAQYGFNITGSTTCATSACGLIFQGGITADLDRNGKPDLILSGSGVCGGKGALHALLNVNAMLSSSNAVDLSTLSINNTQSQQYGFLFYEFLPGISSSTGLGISFLVDDFNRNAQSDFVTTAYASTASQFGVLYLVADVPTKLAVLQSQTPPALSAAIVGRRIVGLAGASLGASLAAADLNLDGKLDLILSAGFTYNGLYILLNLDALALDTAIPFDLNLVSLTNPASRYYGVLFKGTGSGTSFGMSGIRIADINSDGYPDLITSAYNINTQRGAIYVALNMKAVFAGTGATLSFPGAPSSNPASTTYGFAVEGPANNARLGDSRCAVADVNHDGRPDLIVSGYGAISGKGAIYVMLNVLALASSGGSMLLGTNPLSLSNPALRTYGFTITGSVNNQFFGTGEPIIADINSDGRLDILGTAESSQTIYMFLNIAGIINAGISVIDVGMISNGPSSSTYGATITSVVGLGSIAITGAGIFGGANRISIADLDSNGQPDIISPYSFINTVFVSLNVFAIISAGTSPAPTSLANSASPQYGFKLTAPTSSQIGYSGIEVADQFLDGKLDLLIPGWSANLGGGFQSGAVFDALNISGIISSGIASTALNSLAMNSGSNTYGGKMGGAAGQNLGTDVLLGDFNRDGKVDAVISSQSYNGQTTGAAYIIFDIVGALETTGWSIGQLT